MCDIKKNAKEIISNAIYCDQNGRILEAQQYYQDGIQMLMEAVKGEQDVAKKKVFYERIKDYIDRAEQIKMRLQKYNAGAKLVTTIPIDDDSVGHSYKKLFGSYLSADVNEVLIEEPYLFKKHQIQNLLTFMELLVKNCRNLKYVHLVTKANSSNPNNSTEQCDMKSLEQIKTDLFNRKIKMTIKIDENLHDRKIALSNGYIFKIGRGLDFYKATDTLYSLGMFDYDFRKCKQTDVDILRTQSFVG